MPEFKLHGTKPTPKYSMGLLGFEFLAAAVQTAVIYSPTEWLFNNLPRFLSKFILGSPIVESLERFETVAELTNWIPLHLFVTFSWIFRLRFAYSLVNIMRGSDLEEMLTGGIVHNLIDFAIASQLRRNAHSFNLPSQNAAIVSTIIFASGIFIGVKYESDRKSWLSKNPGKLYKEGLATVVRYPHYFSDLLVFFGFISMTNSLWLTLAFTAVQIWGFYSDYIPALDKHLSKKYDGEFKEYAKKTQKLIPYVW